MGKHKGKSKKNGHDNPRIENMVKFHRLAGNGDGVHIAER